MGVSSTLAPATAMLGRGFKGLVTNSYIFWGFLVILVIIAGLAIWRRLHNKKAQWTHKLNIRRVGQDGYLQKEFSINMRRFPAIKGAEIFELEHALLGGYLMPSLNEYTGMNEFSIVIDKNNRIYTNNGEKWCPNKKSVEVSGQHAAIDLARGKLKDDWQKLNKVSDKIDWANIAKYAFLWTLIIAVTVIIIVGLKSWVDAKDADVEESKALASAMASLTDVMETNEAIVNTQQLQILPMLKAMYGTENIQAILKEWEVHNETA